MSHEDGTAGQVREAEDGVPDFVLSNLWHRLLQVFLLRAPMVLDYVHYLVDVHNTCAHRRYEEHPNNSVEYSTHHGKATWQSVQVLRQEVERDRRIALIDYDARVIRLDAEKDVAEGNSLNAD